MMEVRCLEKSELNRNSLDIISDTPDELIMDGKVIMSQILLTFAGAN